MMPIYDMMREAQNGEAMRQMARQFGLSESQVSDAFAALAPAFSTGLKRNVAGPQPLADFLAALSDGRHSRYFEDMQAAFSPQGVSEGNGILGHLFGSKELSRQVAAQAAQATGIGQDILKQMLPVLASVIMGGLFKQATGQAGGSRGGRPSASTGNPLGDIMQEMMRYQSQRHVREEAPPQPNPFDPTSYGPFGQMMEAMFGQGARPGADSGVSTSAGGRDGVRPSPGDNPLGKIFQDMMTAGLGRPEAPQPEPEPDAMPSGRKRNPYDDLFGPMFEAGREAQSGYQKSMESIFDQYLKGMKAGR
jgi:hypothetical protein